MWENGSPKRAGAFLIMDDNSVRTVFTLHSLPLCPHYQLPPIAPPPRHPPSLFVLEVEHCRQCSICLSSGLWDFLPLYLFLSSHWSHFLSRIQPCLSLTCINTPSTSYPHTSLHPSANSTCLLPVETRVILSSSRQCRGGRHNVVVGISDLQNLTCQNEAFNLGFDTRALKLNTAMCARGWS